MDEVSKYRLIGAGIWLALLVIIVPGWYSNPVNFQPGGQEISKTEVTGPIVEQAYMLPTPSHQATQTVPVVNDSASIHESTASSAVETPAAAELPNVPEPKAGEWLVKVAAYKNLANAKSTLEKLGSEYKAWIKEFPASHTFSVRVGPYADKTAAERDKRKIDKALRTQSQIVRVK